MITQPNIITRSEGFPQFSELPLEVQCIIWQFAAPICHDPFIPLFLSAPSDCTTPYTRENPVVHGPWAHMVGFPNSPVLLKTCVESRKAALNFYTFRGWKTKVKGWRYHGHRGANHKPPGKCYLSEDLDHIGERLYWRPSTDVVLFRHTKEPYACEEQSDCNTLGPSYLFRIDERVRFIAMPRELYECDQDAAVLNIPGLEMVFILVDFIPHILKWEKMDRSEDEIAASMREMCCELEKKWKEVLTSASDVFPYMDRYWSKKDNVQFKAVRSLHEIMEVVARRRPPAEQLRLIIRTPGAETERL